MPPPVEEDETQENKNDGNPSPSNKLLKQAETEMAFKYLAQSRKLAAREIKRKDKGELQTPIRVKERGIEANQNIDTKSKNWIIETKTINVHQQIRLIPGQMKPKPFI